MNNRKDPQVPGLDAHELSEPDSDFAMLEHFGQALVPTDKNPNTRPMPLEVPDWGLTDFETQRDRDIRKLSK